MSRCATTRTWAEDRTPRTVFQILEISCHCVGAQSRLVVTKWRQPQATIAFVGEIIADIIFDLLLIVRIPLYSYPGGLCSCNRSYWYSKFSTGTAPVLNLVVTYPDTPGTAVGTRGLLGLDLLGMPTVFE